ncbi:MAG: MBG domain-containing protein [Christensenellales bacterium]
MKRLINYLFILAIGLCIISPKPVIISAETITNSTTISITEDTTIEDDIVLDVLNSDGYVIENGATLTINNSNISGSGAEDINRIFYVKSGGKLILNSVIFSTSIVAKYGIYNEGCIEIRNVTFVNNITTTIYNNSSEENSFRLYSGVIPKLTLGSGYITVFENTYINSPIRVTIENEFDGKVVVKGNGDNVFANKLISNFVLNTSDNALFLDYVGDGCNVTNQENETLNQGDIILTKYTLTTKQGLEYAGNYCTGNKLLQSYIANEEYPIFKCPNPSMILNNYYCNTSKTNYILLTDTNMIDLTINTYIFGNASPITTKHFTYPSGSNYAVFVDIPTGCELYSTSIDGDLTVNENLFSNNYYMRPIIEYPLSTYEYVECEIDFMFKERTTLDIFKKDNVNLTYSGSLVVGEECNFQIEKSENYVINNVKFNNTLVDVTEEENYYSFSIILTNENNIVKISSSTLITITPPKFTFVFGEEIILSYNYYVPSTKENITIEFIPNTNTNVGKYLITQVKQIDEYIITIADGEYYYNITEKEVTVDDIELKSYEFTYYPDFVLTNDMFITYMPHYFEATILFDYDDFVIGEEIELSIQIDISDLNYKFNSGTNKIIKTILLINPLVIDTSNYKLSNLVASYDGLAKSVSIENIDDTLVSADFKYYIVGEDGEKTLIDAPVNSGRYYVEVELSSLSKFYTTDTVLKDYLVINKCVIDLSNYMSQVSNFTYEYDGVKHYTDVKSAELPTEIDILSVENNIGYSNVGIYTITINLDFDKSNYECNSSINSTLTISPKTLTVGLVNNSFVYTGQVPNLQLVVEGVIEEDEVTVNLEEHNHINVGEYRVNILSLSNSNYKIDTEYLNLKIIKARVDFSNITFENIEVVYDGKRHLPVLSGTLPMGISYEIDNNVPCKDVGTYNVKCTFSSSNNNYETPSEIFARVNITPKPIFVEFIQPNNLIANGERKYLEISFSGILNGEDLDYSVTYSGECILAGVYTCTVNLNNYSNYEIINNNKYEFIIYSGTASYVSDDLNLTLEGKFLPNTNIIVSDTSSSINIINAIADKDVKSYSSYKLNYQNYSAEPVTIKIKNTNSINEDNLTIYKVVSGELEKINYSINDGVIIFQLQGSEELVFVEENTLKLGKILITIAVILIIGTITGLTTTLLVINNKKKKKAKSSTLVIKH